MLKMRKKQGKRQRNIKSILAVPIFSSCMFWPAKFTKRFNKKILYFTLVFFCFFLLPWSWSEWLPFGGPRLCNAIWKCKNTNMYENRNTQIQKPWLYKAIWKWGVHIGSSTAGALGTKLPRLPCLRSKKSIFFEETKHLISVCGDSGLQPTVLFPKCISYVYVCIEYQAICCNLNCIWNLGLCIR